MMIPSSSCHPLTSAQDSNLHCTPSTVLSTNRLCKSACEYNRCELSCGCMNLPLKDDACYVNASMKTEEKTKDLHGKVCFTIAYSWVSFGIAIRHF